MKLAHRPGRFWTLREAIEAGVIARAPDLVVNPGAHYGRSARDLERQVLTLQMLKMIEAGEIVARWSSSRLAIGADDLLRGFSQARDLDGFGIDEAGFRAFAQACELAIEDEAQADAPDVRSHRAGGRRDDLDPAIDEALRRANDPADPAAVWNALVSLAQANPPFPPLEGLADGEVKYTRAGEVAFLTRKAFGQRLTRRAERTAKDR